MPTYVDPSPAPSSSNDPQSLVATRTMQVVSFVFAIIYGLIGLEFVLELLAARDGNAFKSMLDTLTSPLLAPFRTLLPTLAVGHSQLIISYLVALAVYGMIHLGIRRLAVMVAKPAPEL